MESSRKRPGIVGLKQDIQKALLDPHLIRPIINQHRMNNIAQFPGSRTDGRVMVLALGNYLLVKSRKHRIRISSHTRLKQLKQSAPKIRSPSLAHAVVRTLKITGLFDGCVNPGSD